MYVGSSMLFQSAPWSVLDTVRDSFVGAAGHATVQAVAQAFAAAICSTFRSVVLTRVFIVVPFASLPGADRALCGDDLDARTRVLDLLGTAGRLPEWNDRMLSRAHRAIPLVPETMSVAPMVASMIAELGIELPAGWSSAPIGSRGVAGSANRMFFVDDARVARDSQGRQIIDQSFAVLENVRSVLGFGGTYLDGNSIVSITFTNEHLARKDADRYASLIGTLKLATMELEAAGKIWA